MPTTTKSAVRPTKYWKMTDVSEAVYQSLLASGWFDHEVKRGVEHERANGGGRQEHYTIDLKAVGNRSACLVMISDIRGYDRENTAAELLHVERSLTHAREAVKTEHRIPRDDIAMRAYFLNSTIGGFADAMKGYRPHSDLSIKLNPTDGKPRWVKE